MFSNKIAAEKELSDFLPGLCHSPYELNAGFGDTTIELYFMVEEFHTLFKHPRRVCPTPDLLRLRAKLIEEEAIKEGVPAVKRGDLDGTLDAMADFLYVSLGTFVSIRGGITMGMSVFSEEQSINRFHKTINPNATPQEDVLTVFKETEVVVAELRQLASDMELQPMNESELVRELSRVLNKLYVACSMAYRLAKFMCIDILELVREVHRSNMTKLWPGDDKERMLAVIESTYDVSDLGFQSCDGSEKMIGFRISDGKILKSPTYSVADLSNFRETVEKAAFGVEWVKCVL